MIKSYIVIHKMDLSPSELDEIFFDKNQIFLLDEFDPTSCMFSFNEELSEIEPIVKEPFNIEPLETKSIKEKPSKKKQAKEKPVKEKSTKKKPVKEKPVKEKIHIIADSFSTDSLLLYEQVKSYSDDRYCMLQTLDKNNICIQYNISKTRFYSVYIKYLAGERECRTDKKYIKFCNKKTYVNVKFTTPTDLDMYKVFIVIETSDFVREIQMKSILEEADGSKIMDHIKIFCNRSMIKNIYSLNLTSFAKSKRNMKALEKESKRKKVKLM